MPFPKGQKMSAEHKAKISAALKGKEGKPHTLESRAKLSAAHVGMKRTAEHRANISAGMTGKTKSAETRAKSSATMNAAWVDPEFRAKMSAAMKVAWADPDLRAKVSAARKAAWNDPEQRVKMLEQLARLHDSWLKSPEGEAASRLGLRSMGTWALVGEQLRERDGDLCQLCLEPVDFDSVHDPMSRSADHIVPRRAGGTDDMGNLWVAHRVCNMKKGARHIGRPDGTTDIRQ